MLKYVFKPRLNLFDMIGVAFVAAAIEQWDTAITLITIPIVMLLIFTSIWGERRYGN
jgi:hypothetical protein